MQDDFDFDLFLREIEQELAEDKPAKVSPAPSPEAKPAKHEAAHIEARPVKRRAEPEISQDSAKIPRAKSKNVKPAAPEKAEENAAPKLSKKEKAQAAKRQKKSALRRSAPFFTALFALSVIAWALPLRPTVSESEKRSLKQFPEFSVESLFSGDYFAGIDDWFSDTFTFRETWIGYADKFKSLYGIRDVIIVSNGGGNAAPVAVIPDVPEDDPLLPSAPPSAQPSEQPQEVIPSEEPLESEAPVVDEPEEWKGVVISDEDFVSKANVLIINNATFKYTGFNEQACDRFAVLANKTGDLLKGKANFYVSLVPENATSMLTREDRLYYGFEPEEDAFERIFSQFNDNVKAVDVIPNLQRHNDEYIVFRTDHHWTALGAYYAYESWCEVAGVEPVPLSEYKEVAWDGFLGTYYYTTGQLKILGDTPDTVYAYEPPGNVKLYLNFSNGDALGEESSIIVDRSYCKPGAKYMTFIGADNCRATFVNEDITDGSAVMVIKTSFGNPYVYYLTQHYQYVYVVDYRYYSGRGLLSFVDKFDVDDVILCAGVGFVAESGGYSILNAYFK